MGPDRRRHPPFVHPHVQRQSTETRPPAKWFECAFPSEILLRNPHGRPAGESAGRFDRFYYVNDYGRPSLVAQPKSSVKVAYNARMTLFGRWRGAAGKNIR